MRLAVDGYYMRGRMRGMAKYGAALTRASDVQSVKILPEQPESRAVRLLTRDQKWFPAWEQIVLPRLALKARCDLLLCPYNTGPIWRDAPPVVVVIHDLIFLNDELGTSPSTVQNMGRRYRSYTSRRIALRCHCVVTCSEFSKQQIVDLFAVPEDKVKVVPNTIGDEWFEHPHEPTRINPYVLAVAGEAPSKNTERLIQAMSHVVRRSPEVRLRVAGVRAGFHDHFRRIAERHGVGHAVSFLPYLEDVELRAEYRRASAFVCPSLAEGFGIPLLEALATGVPAASSHSTSLPEVAGNCALYFDPRNVLEMAEAIGESLSSSSATRDRAARGRLRAAEFRHARVSEKINALWRSM